MPSLRENLKDHPIQSVLTALASLATIIGFYFAIKPELQHETYPTEKVKKSNLISNENDFISNSKNLLKRYSLVGKATNMNSNVSSEAVIEITEISNGKYMCEGRFDEKNLFGRFKVYGEEFKSFKFPNALSIKFEGQIKFGDNDNSGFKEGTKTTFQSTFFIFDNNVTGDYTIDEIPNSYYSNNKQYGAYELNIKSKQKYLKE